MEGLRRVDACSDGGQRGCGSAAARATLLARQLRTDLLPAGVFGPSCACCCPSDAATVERGVLKVCGLRALARLR